MICRGAHGAAGAVQVMLGGAWFGQSFGDPAAAAPALLLQRAQAAVREQLGLEPPPTRSIVRVHQVGDSSAGWGARGGPRGSHRAHWLLPPQACIPQYTLGHWQRTGKTGVGRRGSPGPPRGTHCPFPSLQSASAAFWRSSACPSASSGPPTPVSPSTTASPAPKQPWGGCWGSCAEPRLPPIPSQHQAAPRQ